MRGIPTAKKLIEYATVGISMKVQSRARDCSRENRCDRKPQNKERDTRGEGRIMNAL